MKFIFENVRDFSPVHIFECGQCFRWSVSENGYWKGTALGRRAKVLYRDNILEIESSCPLGSDPEEERKLWFDYFDLGTDYSNIKESLFAFDPGDIHMKNALLTGSGIRLLKQEPFETLISFIISANNNIPRIKKCIENLSSSFGEKILFNGEESYSFPTPETLAACSVQQISDCCKAGYRCSYIIKSAAAFLSSPYSPSALNLTSLQQARKTIMSYCGVGPKVADCILLFTGARFDVFPTDVWVKRVMEKLYHSQSLTFSAIDKLAHEKWGDMTGYAQQYLFYYMKLNPQL